MQERASPRLWIVLVNFRTGSHACACLDSLARQVDVRGQMRVVVVDNASGDDSVPQLEHWIAANHAHAWVTLRPQAENGGFARGNNVVIREALAHPHPPEFVLLLNPDTVVREGALSKLLRYMDAHPDVGMAGPGIEDEEGGVRASAFRFHTALSELETTLRTRVASRLLRSFVLAPALELQTQHVDWVSGACAIIRRTVFEQVGLLDEAYFLYFEEVDLFVRAQRAGWHCAYVPDARVTHIGGQSTGVTGKGRKGARMPGYWFASRRRFFLKTYGPRHAALADLARMTGSAVGTVRGFLRRAAGEPLWMLRDTWRNSVFRRGAQVEAERIK